VNVNLIKEHEDGSATYQFDLTNDEAQSLISFGILETFKSMIREGERLTVEGEDIEDSSNPGLSD